jgi:DNA-binding CsgD family transcriptional regulator
MQTSKSDLRDPRHLGDDSRIVSWPSALGLIIVDESLRPLFSNDEAMTILRYSGHPAQNSFDVLRRKVRASLLRSQTPENRSLPHSILQFKSGRRTYFCRAFALEKDGKRTARMGTAVLIVLEREMPRSLALSHISQQFRLTHREQETVALLLQGLGNKEMAEHMGISENTVKAFLRIVTTKMDVSGRSAIVNKVLDLILSTSEQS